MGAVTAPPGQCGGHSAHLACLSAYHLPAANLSLNMDCDAVRRHRWAAVCRVMDAALDRPGSTAVSIDAITLSLRRSGAKRSASAPMPPTNGGPFAPQGWGFIGGARRLPLPGPETGGAGCRSSSTGSRYLRHAPRALPQIAHESFRLADRWRQTTDGHCWPRRCPAGRGPREGFLRAGLPRIRRAQAWPS